MLAARHDDDDNASDRYNIVEQLQIRNMFLNTCIDFIRQQELIQKYNYYKSQPSEQIFADTYMLKVWFLSLMVHQLFLGYLMPKPFS